MTNNISILPTEMLAYTFSFLEPEDLVRAATVSKEWNEAQKIDELWKRHCLDYLDDTKLHQDTWKEQFKVIKNWMHAEAEKKSFTSYNNGPDNFRNFTILEDDILLEVYPDKSLVNYVIHNFSNDKIIPIDHAKFKDDKIVNSTVQDKTWVALTEQGRILFFDLITGQYLKEITPDKPPLKISNGIIECADDEMITAYHKKINIWDAKTDLLKQTIDASELDEIYTLNSTPNFIICSTWISGTWNIVIIPKSDSSQLKKDRFILSDIAGSGPYVAMIEHNGKIDIFKDTGEHLSFIYTLKPFRKAYGFGKIYIYKNWLMVSNCRKLKIFDIESGKKLSTIKHNERSIAFCSNATQLFVRVMLDNSQLGYKYTLFNFERPITNLNALIPPPKVFAKKKCIIQ